MRGRRGRLRGLDGGRQGNQTTTLFGSLFYCVHFGAARGVLLQGQFGQLGGLVTVVDEEVVVLGYLLENYVVG